MVELLRNIISKIDFKLLILVIILDTIFGILRAIKDKNINSTIGIDGIIRKVGMIISITFLITIDYLVSIDLLGFIPESFKNVIHLQKIGISDLFSIIFILFEILSVFKNMIKCKLPIPKKLHKFFEKLLKDFTSEIKEGEKNERN